MNLGFNWLTLIQTIAIVSALVVNIIVVIKQINQTKIDVLLKITNAHRDLWSNIYKSPKLKRIFKSNVNLKVKPITEEEAMFVNMLFAHMNASVQSVKYGTVFNFDGMEEDFKNILSYPIPNLIWNKNKGYYDKIFVEFISNLIMK